MEVTIGDYGRMMFEIMTGKYEDMPKHWASISEKAKPLVSELIKLNSEMQKQGGSYEIVGYTENGKKKLSEWERVKKIQEHLWGVKAKKLKVGDKIWVNNCDHEMYIGEQNPANVVDVTKNGIYVEMQGCNYEYIIQLDKQELVLKAPDNFRENERTYTNRKYWLEKAEEYGM